MAILMKKVPSLRSGSSGETGVLEPQQWIHVSRPTATITQNTGGTNPEMLFRVFGGRVLVHRLIGEVTTALSAVAVTLKYSAKKLDNSSAVVGSAVDITAASASLSGLEIGGSLTAIGSGAAGIVNNAGAQVTTLGTIPFVVPQGEIYATAAAANATGSIKFDIWYQPLDEGAYVVAQPALTVVI